MSKIIDIYNNLNFINDYNANSTATGILIDSNSNLTIYSTKSAVNNSVGALNVYGDIYTQQQIFGSIGNFGNLNVSSSSYINNLNVSSANINNIDIIILPIIYFS